MNTRETVSGTIAEVTGRSDINTDQDLLESGIIDSFGILQLIMMLEERLAVKFDDDDLDASRFKTIERITSMLDEKIPTN